MRFDDNGKPWTIRLYKTTGKRRTGAAAKRSFQQTAMVLYFDVEHDWSAAQMERNGNYSWNQLASAPATPEAREYKSRSARCVSLRYSGRGKQNEQGLADDLRALGYDEATVRRFLEAAKSHWPEDGL